MSDENKTPTLTVTQVLYLFSDGFPSLLSSGIELDGDVIFKLVTLKHELKSVFDAANESRTEIFKKHAGDKTHLDATNKDDAAVFEKFSNEHKSAVLDKTVTTEFTPIDRKQLYTPVEMKVNGKMVQVKPVIPGNAIDALMPFFTKD